MTQRPRAAGLVLEAINDLDLALEGVSHDAATAAVMGSNCIAWIAGHVTQMLDSWLLHQFMGCDRDPVLADASFSAGGTGSYDAWETLRDAIGDAHRRAGEYLMSLSPADLDRSIPYNGSVRSLQGGNLVLEYALLRIAAHHFAHAAEITQIRSMRRDTPAENPMWGNFFL